MTLFSYLIGVLLARRPLTYLTEVGNLWLALSQWFPMLGEIAGENPHALYNSTYTPLPGNTKSAVQLAYEHLAALGNASTAPKIHILTFDGTASMGGTSTTARATATGNLTGQDVFTETGGAYPAILGYRLKYGLSNSTSTPTLSNKWVWHGIDYHPEYTLTGEPAVIGTQMAVTVPVLTALVPAVGKNIARAVTLAQQVINSIPVGEKIVLSGLSQGSLASRVVYDELRRGSLQARKNDLISVVNFGDGCRPAGRSIPGGNDPGGEGACKLPMWLPLSQQWTPTGLIDNPDTFYWSFANPNDAASCTQSGSTFAGSLIGLGCKALLYGPPPTMTTGWGQLVNDWTTRSDYFKFLGLSYSQPLLDLFNTDPLSPIRVARRTNRAGTDRTALQTSLELASTDPEIRAVYPATLTTTPDNSARTNTKPVFLYCTGTSFAFSAFGDVLPMFSGLSIGKTRNFWGDYTINPSKEVQPGQVAGLNGQVFSTDGEVFNDPFPFMLDQRVWESRRVAYPASAITFLTATPPAILGGMGASIDDGIAKVIAQINGLTPGTPFALGGYSQGAAVMSGVYNQIKNTDGSLYSRRNDFLGGVMFGNPRRQVNYRGPIGGTWSGSWDEAGSNTNGGGSFPGGTNKYARLEGCDDTKWVDFTMPGDIISSTSTLTSAGSLWSQATAALLEIGPDRVAVVVAIALELITGGGFTSQILAAIEAVFTGPGAVTNYVLDAIGVGFGAPGGGHVLYPHLPPPNNTRGTPSATLLDGLIPIETVAVTTTYSQNDSPTTNRSTVRAGRGRVPPQFLSPTYEVTKNYIKAPAGMKTCYQLALEWLEAKALEKATAPILLPSTGTVGWSSTLKPPTL